MKPHTCHLLVLGLSTICSSLAHTVRANPSPCELPPDQGSFSLAYGKSAQTALQGGDTGLRHTQTIVDSGHSADRTRLRFSHTYRAYQLSPEPEASPATNGHVHTLSTDIDLSERLSPLWTLRVQPALSVSSNQLKSPGRSEHRGLQLNASVTRIFPTSQASRWQVGGCVDHRFGQYRAYPTVSWEWHKADWQLQLGWPDNRVYRQMRTTLKAGLSLTPGGNRWRTLGSDGEHDWFSHRAWAARLLLEWRPAEVLGLELAYERLYRNRLEFSLESQAVHRIAGSHLSLSYLKLIWNY